MWVNLSPLTIKVWFVCARAFLVCVYAVAFLVCVCARICVFTVILF